MGIIERMNRATLLVVDDDVMNLRMAQKIFEKAYDVKIASSGAQALQIAEDGGIDLILLDVHMPQMDGHEVMRCLKHNIDTVDIPVIFVTADDDADTEVLGFREGAMDFITKPFRQDIAIQRISRILELAYLQKHLEAEVEKQTKRAEERRKRVEEMSFQTVRTMARAIDARNPYTINHSALVAEYSVLLANALGWPLEDCDQLRYAAIMHDIGKIAIPDSILTKQGTLTDLEYDVMKSHTTVGSEILGVISDFLDTEYAASQHHERYDGTGYPYGLKGDDIHPFARIVAIADAYEAMTSERSYRKRLPKEAVRKELEDGRGTQFDPMYLDVFLRLFDTGKLDEVAEKFSQNESVTIENMDPSTLLLERIMETANRRKADEGVDFITGLDTRAVGEQKIAAAMTLGDGCLAFIDVDNLKKINDTVGHKYGDRLLKLMGDVLKNYSNYGIPCRLGGDEFIFYLANIDMEQATEVIRNLMHEFLEKKDADPALRQAALSIGLCMSTKGDCYADIYAKADKALYHVKQNGKANYYFYQKQEYSLEQKTDVDLDQLMQALSTSGSYSGAMDVEYREFAKLFEYVGNLRRRYKHGIHLVMITMDVAYDHTYFIDELEDSMQSMETAIQQTIRNVDIYTRFSSVQFLVILFEAGDENLGLVLDRIFASYYRIRGTTPIAPTYSIRKLEGEVQQ